MSVLAAEARRAARRWSTAALRTAFALVLLVALVIAVAASSEAQVWHTGEGGRGVFLTLRWTALALLAFLAPALGALGMAEERAGARFDLLVLTRIPPWRLFADKVGSRLLLAVAVLAGAMPLLALATTYGGVAPAEVLATAVSAVHLAALSALLGAWLALRVGRGILAAVGAVGLVAVLWFGLPLWSLVGWEPHPTPTLIPALSHHPLEAALAAATSVPLATLILWDGARHLAGRSTSTAEKLLILPLAVGALALPAVTGLMEELGFGLPGPALLGAWGLAMALASAGAVWLPVRLVALSTAARETAPTPAATGRTRDRVRVWSNPVAWRELRTKAHGHLGRAHLVLVALAGLGAFISFSLVSSASRRPDLETLAVFAVVLSAILGALAFAWGLLVTGYVGGRLGTQEALGGTVEALVLTTASRGRLIRGKLAAAAVHGLVPMLLGVALVVTPALVLVLVEQPGLVDSPVVAASGLLGLAIAIAVVVAAWAALTLGGLGLGLTLPRPRSVPALTLATAALLLPVAWIWLPTALGLSLLAEEEPEATVVAITVQLVLGSILAAVAVVGGALAHHRLSGRPSG